MPTYHDVLKALAALPQRNDKERVRVNQLMVRVMRAAPQMAMTRAEAIAHNAESAFQNDFTDPVKPNLEAEFTTDPKAIARLLWNASL